MAPPPLAPDRSRTPRPASTATPQPPPYPPKSRPANVPEPPAPPRSTGWHHDIPRPPSPPSRSGARSSSDTTDAREPLPRNRPEPTYEPEVDTDPFFEFDFTDNANAI